MGHIGRWWALVFAVAFFAIAGVALAQPTAFTVNPKGVISAGGQDVTISGSVTCDAFESDGTTPNTVEVFAAVEQLHAPHGYIADGDGSSAAPIACTGAPQPWAVTVTNVILNASFVPGPGFVFDAQACDNSGPSDSVACSGLTDRTITLQK